jgi:CxxC motif-containing protein (DUF1111 family)
MKLQKLAGLMVALALAGCGGEGGSTTASDTSSTTQTNTAVAVAATPTATASPASVAGDPLTGLSDSDLALFNEGKVNFTTNEQDEPGFGPTFNGKSCVECHNGPAIGGGSPISVTRFGQTVHGVFDALSSKGGSLLQTFSINGTAVEVVPPEANVTTRRRTTPLFGAGLIEAIPDADITAFAQQQAAQNPGQAGLVHMVTSPSDGAQHVGRFGWKSQQALLLDFAADAYANEMGISNPLFPIENQPNGPAITIAADQVDDPPNAQGVRDIDRLTNYMRLLAPPPTVVAVQPGQTTFQGIGCAVCHHPSFTTASLTPALNNKTIAAYSDFLLHDVGTGDGIVQGQAPANMLRTAPLMGVGTQAQLLHDASARTVDAAIRAHGGQATASRDAYVQLSTQDRQNLLNFIQTL